MKPSEVMAYLTGLLGGAYAYRPSTFQIAEWDLESSDVRQGHARRRLLYALLEEEIEANRRSER